MTRVKLQYLTLFFFLVLALPAEAQAPRISTFFPIGARAGSSVDVEIRGSDLTGADKLLVDGKGIEGVIDPGSAKVDETYKPLWQSKCQSCHELRSPANRSLSAAQWAATVERMVKVRQAPLSDDEMHKVTAYLESAARAGKVTAHIQVAQDAMPGVYELRVATPHGVSSVGLFEIGNLAEIVAASNDLTQPMPVTLPCVANGNLTGQGERDCFKFTAQQGQRVVFDLKGCRYSDLTQMYFNPDLRLYDSSGQELVENHGFHELDPLIDWTCPKTGDYTLEVRDLLGKGNPDSVYRLSMGTIPYDEVLFPPGGQAKSQVSVSVVGKDLTATSAGFKVNLGDRTGLSTVNTPWGMQPFYCTPYPVTSDTTAAKIVTLPAGFTGRFLQAGQKDTYTIQGTGSWVFRSYAGQLGSSATIRMTVKNQKGDAIASRGGRGGGLTANLEAGQNYRLEVTDNSNEVGAEHVYFIEARPANSYIACEARPPNLFVHPGSSTVVEVQLTRRDGVNGDVTVNADNLPKGVTAFPAVIQPDRDRAWLILTADAEAPQTDQPFDIEATANGANGTVHERCSPMEEYRINGNLRYIERSQCVLGVRGQPDFTASVASGDKVSVSLQKGVEVKVKIDRKNGYKGDVYTRIVGLPSGWTTDPVGIPGSKSEATLIVRPDGNDRRPFTNRDPKLTPITAIVEVVENEIPTVAGVITVEKPPAGEKEDTDG